MAGEGGVRWGGVWDEDSEDDGAGRELIASRLLLGSVLWLAGVNRSWGMGARRAWYFEVEADQEWL